MWTEWVSNLSLPLLKLPIIRDIVYNPEFSPATIMNSIIAFMWAVYLWETYMSYRQHKIVKKTLSVPSELIGVIDQATYTKSRLYTLDKSKFGFISGMWEQLFQTGVLVYGGIPLIWKLSGKVLIHFDYNLEHEITQTIVFFLLGSLVCTIIDLPWSYYFTFVIEQRHGFNKETVGFFFKDRMKKFIVLQAISLPIVACTVHIVKIGGDYFFVVLWLFTVAISLVLMTVYPDYIAPFFDNFTPLPDGSLKTRIEALAGSINFPLKKLYIVDGSKRSAHSNAYFYGFYKNKRIVLFDTLLENYNPSNKTEDKKDEDHNDEDKVEKKGCSDDEIIAVLAHELGHWKLNHVTKNMIIIETSVFLCFAAFSLLFKNKSLFAAFGFAHQQPVIIGFLIIFQYVFSPYNEVLSFLMTALSRKFEFQADAFAKMLNKAADLRSALIKLNADNLSYPVHDWLYSAWHHSHPPVLQRIRALGKID